MDRIGLKVGAASVLCGMGIVFIVAFLSWSALPNSLNDAEMSITGVGVLLLGVSLFLMGKQMLAKSTGELEWAADSKVNYGRCLVGVGFFLLLDAILNVVAFAGFAHGGYLSILFPDGRGFEMIGTTPPDITSGSSNIISSSLMDPRREGMFLAVTLLVSMGMALLGALFFFANSLWDKIISKDIIEPFDPLHFWAGLWFRLAEAIIFTVALFLLFCFMGKGKMIHFLPLFALFVGMFVKSAETVFAGIATRLFAAVSALIGPPHPTQDTLQVDSRMAKAKLSLPERLRGGTDANSFIAPEHLVRLMFSGAEVVPAGNSTRLKIPIGSRFPPKEKPTFEQNVQRWLTSFLPSGSPSPVISWKQNLDGTLFLTLDYPARLTVLQPER